MKNSVEKMHVDAGALKVITCLSNIFTLSPHQSTETLETSNGFNIHS